MNNFKANAKVAIEKVKGAAVKSKNVIVNTTKKAVDFSKGKISEFKEKRDEQRQKSIDDYKIDIDEAKTTIDQKFVLEFLDILPDSPVDMNKNNAEKIKRIFPIPCEQTIIWADCEFDVRPSGIALTEKGIFIKTDVSIKEEKFVKKGERKLSELYYYKWSQFDPNFFVSEDEENNTLMSVNSKCVDSFKNACLKVKNQIDSVDQINSKNIDNKIFNDGDFIASATASAGGMSLSGLEAIIRNNSVNNTSTGHGIMAEHANTLNDILNLKSASVIGGDNAKNGADRLVNGEKIQTKYCKTGVRSVNAAFDNAGSGKYRYIDKETGKLMKLEVPSDQYDAAIKTFKNKISEGKVCYLDANGNEVQVTDPNEASNVIVKGKYEYQQAKNLAKAGTIQSLTYDAATGVIVGATTFSISFLITTYLSYRQTHNIKEAVIYGLKSGGKAGLTTMTSHVLISQLSRTKAFKNIMSSNVLKSGAVSGIATFVILSIPDTYRILTKKISRSQYISNICKIGISMAGGMGGAALATSIAGAGQTGAIIAGVVGGSVGVIGLGIAAGAVASIIYEGDDIRHTRLLNAIIRVMATEYLLSENEMDLLLAEIDKVQPDKFKKLYENLNIVNHQEKEIRKFLEPYFDKIIEQRETIFDNTFIEAFAD